MIKIKSDREDIIARAKAAVEERRKSKERILKKAVKPKEDIKPAIKE